VAALLHRAIGPRLHGIFVDNGLLQQDEFTTSIETYEDTDTERDRREHCRSFIPPWLALATRRASARPSAVRLVVFDRGGPEFRVPLAVRSTITRMAD
jgi:hypothetical protein